MADIGAALGKLVAMTHGRDPRALEGALLEAIQALLAPGEVRLACAHQQQDGWVWNDQARRDNDPANPAPPWAPALDAAFLAGFSANAPFCTADAVLVWPLDSAQQQMRCLLTKMTASAEARQFAGQAHALYRNHLALLQESQTDTLTGLLNRKTFDTLIDRLNINHACVAVLDIDHFKCVNDRFGHLYGDEVLILFARLMESSFRDCDQLFRFGGEEFVVVLRDNSIDNAIATLDRFRMRVANHLFPQVGQVTTSIGAATLKVRHSPYVVVHQADQALYFAKQNGRNRVFSYEHLLSRGLINTPQPASDIVVF